MDKLTNKLNALGSNLRQVDKTFPDWQNAFASFSLADTCHEQGSQSSFQNTLQKLTNLSFFSAPTKSWNLSEGFRIFTQNFDGI